MSEKTTNARIERLKAALRDNLKRRKTRAQGKAAEPPVKPPRGE